MEHLSKGAMKGSALLKTKLMQDLDAAMFFTILIYYITETILTMLVLLLGQKLTVDQFLSKLPSSVVRAGRVINIRSSLSDSLRGSAENAQCPVTVV